MKRPSTNLRRPPLRWSDAARRGFTLVEVLAALVIFGVAIVGIIQGIDTAIAYQSDLGMRQRAAMLASNVLEEIKYGNDVAEGEDQGQFENEDAVYTWRTAIEKTDLPGLMKVTAVVAWGPQDNLKEYSISALMYSQAAAEEDSGEDPTDPNQQPPQQDPQMGLQE